MKKSQKHSGKKIKKIPQSPKNPFNTSVNIRAEKERLARKELFKNLPEDQVKPL